MSIKLHLQAWREFGKRYQDIFMQVWKVRDQLESKDYLPHEAQFLPAALSLQETPVSPIPRIIMRVLISFAVITLLWSIIGKMDIVATAQGKVISSDRTKIIQPIGTAMVKAIHVTDGQAVTAGQVLIELDPTMARADVDRIKSSLDVTKLSVDRARAMLDSLEKNQEPQLIARPEVDVTVRQEAQQQLTGQYQEYTTKIAQIEADIAKKEAELNSTHQLVRKYELMLPIVKQREKSVEELYKKQFISKNDYLIKQQERIEQEANLAVYRSRTKEIEASLLEVRNHRSAYTAETKRAQLDSLNEGLQKVASLEEELIKANNQSQLMTLTAPVDGTVQQLAVHTVGGVVTEAQQLLLVVPKNDAMEVEAFVENKDIGFVEVGQEAEVKIQTFQYTKYGTIPATVMSVSHDAIADEKRGLIYSARIKMARSTMNVNGKEVNLSPGMEVGVEIKTGKRRVIEYFLSPLKQYKHESLQER